MDLLAVLAQPQEVGGEWTLGLVRISLSLLSLLLLRSCRRASTDGNELASLEESTEVDHAGIQFDGATKPCIRVINVGGDGVLEGIVEGDP